MEEIDEATGVSYEAPDIEATEASATGKESEPETPNEPETADETVAEAPAPAEAPVAEVQPETVAGVVDDSTEVTLGEPKTGPVVTPVDESTGVRVEGDGDPKAALTPQAPEAVDGSSVSSSLSETPDVTSSEPSSPQDAPPPQTPAELRAQAELLLLQADELEKNS